MRLLMTTWCMVQAGLTLACTVGAVVAWLRSPKLTKEDDERLIYRS